MTDSRLTSASFQSTTQSAFASKSARKLILLFLLAVSFGVGNLFAVTGTTNPNLFNLGIDWCAQYGCANQPLQMSTPVPWAYGGYTGNINLLSGGNVELRQQNPTGFTWNGNFIDGMGVIYNGVDTLGNSPGAILMTFDQAVFGAGVYIQSDIYGPFTASVQLYDTSSNPIGNPFFASGNSDTNVGTALFIGAYDNVADVGYALFDTNDENFGIAAMGLKTSQGATPEPGTLLLVGPSLLGLAGVVRRRLARKTQEVL